MSKQTACPCEGQSLDRLLSPTILAFLADGPLHGYALVDRLATSPLMNGTKPNRAGVYRTLVTMEAHGTVTHAVSASEIGPAKRLYQLTEDGRVCLKKWIATLEDYYANLHSLTEMMRDAASRSQSFVESESETPEKGEN